MSERMYMPLKLPKLDKLQEKCFWTYVEKCFGCWHWKGPKSFGKFPYGRFNANGRSYFAHRIAYQLVKGKIPKGNHVHHKCGNAICVKPSHLQALTIGDHTLLGQSPPARNARKHTCIRGHKFTTRRRDGARDCLKCRKIQTEKDKYRLRRIWSLRPKVEEMVRAAKELMQFCYEDVKGHHRLWLAVGEVEAALSGKAE